MMKNSKIGRLAVGVLCVIFARFFAISAVAADHNIWPERVTELMAVCDEKTGYVTISLVAPTHSMTSLGDGNGEPLSYLTKIVLSRNLNFGEYEEIHTFENPAPGAALSYVDLSATAGIYQYKAVAYVDDYASYPEWYEIQVGQISVDIINVTATSDKGNPPVTLMFTAPSKDTEGVALKAIERIEVSRYSHDTMVYEEIGSIDNPQPGSWCTYEDINVVAGESYSYKLRVFTDAGHSYGTIKDVYVGLDAPVAPTDVRASIVDDGVLITWVASTTGQANGYVERTELQFAVLRSATGYESDAVMLAEGLLYEGYVDTETFDEELKFTYFVRAYNAQGSSTGAASNAIVVGPPAQLPYVESFDSVTEFAVPTTDHVSWSFSSSETACAWSINNVVDLEDRQITTESGEGGMAVAMYGPYNDLQQDDYMTTGKIALDSERVLLKFRYYAFTGSNSTLAVEISANGKEYQEVGVIEYAGMPQERWITYSVPLYGYLLSTDKELQVRLHAHKGTMAQPIIVDDFVITQLPGVENVSCDFEKRIISWSAPQCQYAQLTGYEVSLNGITMAQLPVETPMYDYSDFYDEYFLTFSINAIYEDKYYSDYVILDLTAVDEVEQSTVVVKAANGVLQVEATNGDRVMVYSQTGVTIVDTCGDVYRRLLPGVYIVKCGNMVRKVVL